MKEEQNREIETAAIFAQVEQLLLNLPAEEEVIEYNRKMEEENRKQLIGQPTIDLLPEECPGTIILDSFELLQAILVQILKFSIKEAEDIIRHEQAHFETAKKFGLSPIICLNLWKTPDNQMMIAPNVAFKIPDEMDPQKVREIVKAITEAPDEMSDFDKESLKILEENK